MYAPSETPHSPFHGLKIQFIRHSFIDPPTGPLWSYTWIQIFIDNTTVYKNELKFKQNDYSQRKDI